MHSFLRAAKLDSLLRIIASAVTVGACASASYAAGLTGPALPGGTWQAVGMVPADAAGNAAYNITVDPSGYIYVIRRPTNPNAGEVWKSTTPGGGTFTSIGNGDYPAGGSPIAVGETPQGAFSAAGNLYYLNTSTNSWTTATFSGAVPYTFQGINALVVDSSNRIMVAEVYTPKVAISGDGGKTYNVVDLGTSMTNYVNQTYPSTSTYSYSTNPGAITGIAALSNGSYMFGGEFSAVYKTLPSGDPNDYTRGSKLTGIATSYANLLAGNIDWSTYDTKNNLNPPDNTSGSAANAVNSQIFGFANAGDKWGTNLTRSGQTLWATANYGSPIQVLDSNGVPHYASGLVGVAGRTQLDGTNDYVDYSDTAATTITNMPLTNYGYNFFLTRGGIYATDGTPDSKGNIDWFKVQTTGLPAGFATDTDWMSGTDNSLKMYPDAIATYGNFTYVVGEDGEVYRFSLPVPEPSSIALIAGASALNVTPKAPAYISRLSLDIN